MKPHLFDLKKFSPVWLFQFQQLVQSQSFTEAAQKLNISQQTLSKNMQALEKFLEMTLFERNNKHLKLLPQGELLYANLKQLLEPLKALHKLKNSQKQKIKIGIVPFWSRNYFAEILTQLMQDWPHVEIEVLSLAQAQLVSFLQIAEFDVILTLEVPTESCRYHVLPNIHWVLAAHPNCIAKGLPYHYFNYQNFTHPDPGLLTQYLKQALPIETIDAGYIDSVPLLKSILLKGTGCAWILESEIADEVKSGQLKILYRSKEIFASPCIVLSGAGETHPVIQDLIKLLQQTMSKPVAC